MVFDENCSGEKNRKLQVMVDLILVLNWENGRWHIKNLGPFANHEQNFRGKSEVF